MKPAVLALFCAALLSGGVAAQEGERRCCHVTEGAWIDGTYTPAQCRALGTDYAPQGDSAAGMCRRETHEEIPPLTPGAPGSPGGGAGDGDGDGSGADGGDGSGDGSGGAGVQRSEGGPQSETASLADMRFDYETVGRASLPELGVMRDHILEQRDFCDDFAPAEGVAGQAMGEMGATCFTNLRGNAHLVTQNAGRMRNDRTLNEDERHEAAHIMQQASDTRAHADTVMDAEN